MTNTGTNEWLSMAHVPLHKCFMSEKGCTFERDIKRYIDKKNEHNKKVEENNKALDSITPKDPNQKQEDPACEAFVVMPFSPYMDEAYELQIKPFLSNSPPRFFVSRADSVMKTGYVMCEKICRKIQEANLIVAEISTQSVNVYYEVGLCAGLGKKIVFLAQNSGDGISKDAKSFLDRLGVPKGDYNTQYLSYHPFSYLQESGQDVADALWKIPTPDIAKGNLHPKIGVIIGRRPSDKYDPADVLKCVLGNIARDIVLEKLEGASQGMYETEQENTLRQITLGEQQPTENEHLTNRSHVLDCIGRHVEHWRENEKSLILSHCDFRQTHPKHHQKMLPYMPWTIIDSKNSRENHFAEMLSFVEQCECLVIDTSPDAEPINFFWVGYAHARGKHVIPINISADSAAGTSPTNSPFDVRGLWLVYFDTEKPHTLKTQLEGILNKIISDAVDKKVRRKFWEPFLSDVNLSIVVGADIEQGGNRHTVGAADYLALAELVSFLSQEKPTLDIRIETPVRRPVLKQGADLITKETLQTYTDHIESMLKDKNCILIGSPAVNVAAEIVFANAKKVAPFEKDLKIAEELFCGYVAVAAAKNRGFTYYGPPKKENFMAKCSERGASRPEGTFFSSSLPENVNAVDKCRYIDESFGHVALFKNPYCSDSESGKMILVLSGITGTATLATAQVLTGSSKNYKCVSDFLGIKDGGDPGNEALKAIAKKLKQAAVEAGDTTAGSDLFYKYIRTKRSKVDTKEEPDEKPQEDTLPEGWHDFMEALATPHHEFKVASDAILSSLIEKSVKEGQVEALLYILSKRAKQDQNWDDRRQLLHCGLAKGPRHAGNPSKFDTKFTITHDIYKWPFPHKNGEGTEKS